VLGWALRVRSDAAGFYRRAQGRIIGHPFATLDEAEQVRRAMPNGGEFEAVEVK
jgi:hypothetical protein